jgi:hypothetical protein
VRPKGYSGVPGKAANSNLIVNVFVLVFPISKHDIIGTRFSYIRRDIDQMSVGLR